MLEPVGPLDPSLYWRRRAATLVALLVAVALIVWLTGRLFAGDQTPEGTPAGSSSESSTTSSHSAPASASGSSVGGEPSGGAPSSESLAVTEGPAVTEAPAPAVPAPDQASVSPVPAGPVICDPAQIEVQAAVLTDPIRIGVKPQLMLSVVNKSATECLRDLNSAGQELLIYGADGARLWSSNDCYPGSSDDTRLLAPGQKVDFTVVWAGRTSAPGCATPRTTLGAGSYQLEPVQGGLVGARVPLTIQP